MTSPNKRSFVLSPQKRAVLASLLQEKGMSALLSQEIPRRQTPDPVRLSFSQERVWFLEQLQPGSSVHNIPAAFRLPGPLNILALEQSINKIVERHEVLRTTFRVRDGQPVQVIAPSLTVELPLLDLREVSPTMRQMEAYRLATEEALRPFDLAQGPMIRTTLVRLAAMDHLLLLTLHHIVSDGWSMGIVWRELAALYEQERTGRPAGLPNLPIQYADFAEWQRGYLQGEILDNHLEFWRKQLAGAPSVLSLPIDRPRPAVQRFAGALESWLVSPRLTRGLKRLSEQEDVTLFMTLLAAFKSLLSRYTGQVDLVIGTPIANRTRTETEGLIGFFVNMLVLRTDLSGRPGFREALRRVREVTLGAYAHQDLPFEKLVEAQQPERDLSHNPLFQVMFVFQNTPTAPQSTTAQQPAQTSATTPTNAPQSPLQSGTATAKFDLTLFATETDQGLAGAIEYNTDLFEAASIKRMAGHFQILLDAIVTDPDQRLAELNLLATDERQQILRDWNATDASYRDDACIHELFEAQAAKTPQAVALACGDQQLTYSELDQRANYVAALLGQTRVGLDAPVGVLAERSIEAVVVLLGILKAGGAYVALEPSDPKERIAAILSDCNAPVLFSQGQLAQQLPLDGLQLINLDDLDWKRAAADLTPAAAGATPDSLACVLYTSGPNGQPVGIGVPQKAIVGMVFDTRIVYLGASDRVAQLSKLSASFSTFEIWGALLHGAQLTVIPANPFLSPRLFAAEIAERKISVTILTTVLFNYLQSEVPHALLSVRDLYVGGEAADPQWIRKFLRQQRPARLINMYGLSECTPLTVCEAIAEVPEGTTAIPIGRPISNTQVYILDELLRPVPVGVVGELCIGGVGLARGYFNRPDLTAEHFIPNQFSDRPGARLCRTGDLARYLGDGRIQFVGRADRMTKISGLRVEPREIEAALEQHPLVAEAIVLTRIGAAGDKRLTAYAVTDSESEPPPGELRRFMRSKLPEYMVPSDFIAISSLPRTADGHRDLAALPLPETERPPLEETFVAPDTPVEKELVRIWSQVFGLGKVGIRDNFFRMGGHSLLATQVISRARDAFKVELPVRRLFESPTIEGLARYVEAARGSQVQADVPVARGQREPALDHLGELSEEEVDSLLTEMLQQEIPPPVASEAPDRISRGGEEELLGKLDHLPAHEIESLLGQLLTEVTSE